MRRLEERKRKRKKYYFKMKRLVAIESSLKSISVDNAMVFSEAYCTSENNCNKKMYNKQNLMRTVFSF